MVSENLALWRLREKSLHILLGLTLSLKRLGAKGAGVSMAPWVPWALKEQAGPECFAWVKHPFAKSFPFLFCKAESAWQSCSKEAEGEELARCARLIALAS